MTHRTAVVVLALALAGSPAPSAAQAERPSDTAAIVTGGLVGTGASSLTLFGLCASRVIADDELSSLRRLAFGAMIAAAPSLTAGYGLAYPDRSSWADGLRTVVFGVLGRSLQGLAASLASAPEEPSDSSGRGLYGDRRRTDCGDDRPGCSGLPVPFRSEAG